MNISERLQQYREIFTDNTPLVSVRSPGRVNLIGEHTDYNDGFVLPMAMTQAMHVIAGQADDQTVKAYSTAFGQTAEFLANQPGSPDDYPDEPEWMKYVRGVAALLVEKGIELKGCRLLIDSEVPIGGGVSSSAALEVGSAMALLGVSMSALDGIELALLAQKAEHEYAHSPCGIMDQFICVLGKTEQALLLDCRTQKYDYVPLPMTDMELVVMNTQVKHSIGGSEYPVRQQQCRDGLAVFKEASPRVKALRDVNSRMLEEHKARMDEITYRRCRHVITENERTQQAAESLQKKDLATFGQLLYQSHDSLRDDYEVSCPELDRLVKIASQVDGVYGARMTGGGFGGCAIALVKQDAVETLKTAIADQYDGQFEKPAIVYTTYPSSGATILPVTKET
jgi:galactokinase